MIFKAQSHTEKQSRPSEEESDQETDIEVQDPNKDPDADIDITVTDPLPAKQKFKTLTLAYTMSKSNYLYTGPNAWSKGAINRNWIKVKTESIQAGHQKPKHLDLWRLILK